MKLLEFIIFSSLAWIAHCFEEGFEVETENFQEKKRKGSLRPPKSRPFQRDAVSEWKKWRPWKWPKRTKQPKPLPAKDFSPCKHDEECNSGLCKLVMEEGCPSCYPICKVYCKSKMRCEPKPKPKPKPLPAKDYSPCKHDEECSSGLCKLVMVLGGARSHGACPSCYPVCKVYCKPKMRCEPKSKPEGLCTKEEINSESKKGPWKSCVGMTSNDCKVHIEKGAPCLNIVIMKPGMASTWDFRHDRVRIYEGKTGVVAWAPHVG